LQQSPQPSPAKSTTPVGKGINSAEKRKDLIMKCQQTLQSIPKIPLKRRKQMAALASEADASLKAAGGILGGAWAVNPTEAVKSMLDDAEFFIREIDRCSESTKKGKSCTLSTDAQGVLRDYTEQALSQSLQDLPSYCDVSEFTPNQPNWVPVLGNIRPGVKVYLGPGPKTYWAEVVDIEEHHKMLLPDGTIKEFRGIRVRFPNGSIEWKDLDWLINQSHGQFFIREDDPARRP
jgi:ribosomal protein L34E